MDEKKFEKLLSAHVDAELCDRFLQQASTRSIVKKRALAAAINLWIELPPEIQARLLDRSMKGNAFVELVQQIVDERIGSLKPKKEPAQKSPRQQLREALIRIREMVEIETKQPGTIYRVLDNDEQKVLDEFRRLMAPKEHRKSRSA